MEKSVLKLITPSGFKDAFEQRLNQFPTYKEAYESLEQTYSETFGQRRYSSYDSFRISSRRIKSSIEVW